MTVMNMVSQPQDFALRLLQAVANYEATAQAHRLRLDATEKVCPISFFFLIFLFEIFTNIIAAELPGGGGRDLLARVRFLR